MHAADVKRREIVDDKAALEQVLGRRIDLFSYPYGDFDAETVALVAEAGYRAAMTVESGLVAAGGNRLLIPRYEITRRDHATFSDRVLELFDYQRTVPKTNGCASPLT
jgi:peptidoglycan/xylan/chitin deacetylase (PgdA/CDA1 family)